MKHTVLAVEKEDEALASLRLALSPTDIELVSITSLDEALKKINTNMHFDLLILDEDLPAVKGWQFMAHIKRLGLNAPPVIILTRGSAFGPVLRGLRAGAKFLLAKPFNPQILVKAVEYLLGEGNSEELSKLEADLLTSTGVFFSLLGRADAQPGQATA